MIIICYHGVSDEKKHSIINFNGKHINFKIFSKQIRYIGTKCKPISMKQVNFNLKNKIPFEKKSVCVTFDDGFKNNFKFAIKILKKYNVPAIFYLCPDLIDKKEMFWVDKIEASIAFSKEKKIEFFFRKNYSFNISNIKKKKAAIKKFKTICKKLPDKDKDVFIKKIIYSTKVKPSQNLHNDYKILSWKEVRKITKDPLFDIGGHSKKHSIFTNMSVQEVDQDIKKTKKIIFKNTSVRVKHFSYPEGKSNQSVANLMKKNGILTCPIASGKINNHLQNPYNLKRVMVGFNNTKFPYE
tara:strand:+ start:5439 stop:6329 length:891 start_codon:yes stop_codon:yes gene_type:complete